MLLILKLASFERKKAVLWGDFASFSGFRVMHNCLYVYAQIKLEDYHVDFAGTGRHKLPPAQLHLRIT